MDVTVIAAGRRRPNRFSEQFQTTLFISKQKQSVFKAKAMFGLSVGFKSDYEEKSVKTNELLPWSGRRLG